MTISYMELTPEFRRMFFTHAKTPQKFIIDVSVFTSETVFIVRFMMWAKDFPELSHLPTPVVAALYKQLMKGVK